MQIKNNYLTRNPYFNDGKWIAGSAFKGFFLHSVGVGQPNPLVFIQQWNKPSYTNAGINGFIGEDVIYITAPCLETPGKVKRMPHAGKPAGNNGYIGFEMCEPGRFAIPAAQGLPCGTRLRPRRIAARRTRTLCSSLRGCAASTGKIHYKMG